MNSGDATDRNAITDLVRRWYDEVWNEGREESLYDLLHPRAVVHGIGTGPLIGPDGFLPFWKMTRLNYSNIQIQLAHVFVQADQAIATITNRSVRVANGKDMLTHGAAFFRVKEGQIVFSRHVIDYLAILGQSEALDLDIHDALFPIHSRGGSDGDSGDQR